MRNGLLRHRVALQSVTETSDGAGGFTETWAEIADGRRWASVEPLNGREYFEAQRVGSDVTHKVTMRYEKRVTPSHRISHDGRTLEIVSVLNAMDKNERMQLMCKETTT